MAAHVMGHPGQQVAEHLRVHRCAVRHHLLGETRGPHPSEQEELASSCRIASLREENIHHLSMLVDGPIEIAPGAADPDVGLIDVPPPSHWQAVVSGSVDEERSETPDPAVDSHMIDLDAALGEQLLEVAVGEVVAEIPAHGDGDEVGRKTEAPKGSGTSERSGHCPTLPDLRRSRPSGLRQRNRPLVRIYS